MMTSKYFALLLAIFSNVPVAKSSAACNPIHFPSNQNLPITVGPFEIFRPGGPLSTSGTGEIPLGEEISVTTHQVQWAQIALRTTNQLASINVTVNYTNGQPSVVNNYLVGATAPAFALNIATDGSKYFTVRGPNNDSWLSSICVGP